MGGGAGGRAVAARKECGLLAKERYVLCVLLSAPGASLCSSCRPRTRRPPARRRCNNSVARVADMYICVAVHSSNSEPNKGGPRRLKQNDSNSARWRHIIIAPVRIHSCRRYLRVVPTNFTRRRAPAGLPLPEKTRCFGLLWQASRHGRESAGSVAGRDGSAQATRTFICQV